MRESGLPASEAFYIEGLYAAATFCTPGSRTHVSLTLFGLASGPRVLTKTLLQPKGFDLDLRSDDRGMSHSANEALEPRLGAGLFHSGERAPAAPRFPAVSPSGLVPRRPAFSIGTRGSTAQVGHVQPRFTLLVTHVGIDDQELSALGDVCADGALAIWGMPSVWPSGGSARPSRLATFSSCQSHS